MAPTYCEYHSVNLSFQYTLYLWHSYCQCSFPLASFCRHPVLVLEEQPLRLAQRLAANHATPLFSCSLRGSLTVEPDGEGVCVALDRLETLPNGVCRPNTLEQLPHREVLVHAKVRRNSVRGEASVVQDYEQDLQVSGQHGWEFWTFLFTFYRSGSSLFIAKLVTWNSFHFITNSSDLFSLPKFNSRETPCFLPVVIQCSLHQKSPWSVCNLCAYMVFSILNGIFLLLSAVAPALCQ